MLSAAQWTSSNLTVGCRGSTGPVGPSGPSGPAGPVGPTGPSGVAGVSGPSGPSGVSGNSSLVGPSGPAGVLTSRISFINLSGVSSFTFAPSSVYGILILTGNTSSSTVQITQSTLSSGNWMMLKNCSTVSVGIQASGKTYSIPSATDSTSPLYYVYYDGTSLYLY